MNSEHAKLSTSSPFLEVPKAFFRPLVVSALGGTFNEDLDLYTVDCGKVDSFPSMSINMGSGFGLIYEVKANDYVAKIVRFLVSHKLPARDRSVAARRPQIFPFEG